MYLPNWTLVACAVLSVANALPSTEAGMPDLGGSTYTILHTKETATERAKIVAAVEALLATLMRNVTADAFRSTGSPAFMAFFKNIANRQIVFDALQTITTGPPDKRKTPRITTVNGRGQIQVTTATGEKDPYYMCLAHGVQSIYADGGDNAPLIILCPDTLELPVTPSMSYAACLRVDHHFNRFTDDGNRLSGYLMWALFIALLDAYNKNALLDIYTVTEVNECFSLSASLAVKNPFSWIYYAASVRLGCTDFPSSRRHDHGVELLEINGTDSAVTLNGITNLTSLEGGQKLSPLVIQADNVSFGSNVQAQNVSSGSN